MTVKKISGKWKADLWPNGAAGKRYRKSFDTKAEALRWEAWIIKNKQESPAWEPKTQLDNRKLSELIHLWYVSHGKNLRKGEQTKRMLDRICEGLNNPKARLLTATDFAKYRNDRQDAGISIKMLNYEHDYLSAVFNELINLENWKLDNPLTKLKKLKEKEKEPYWLKNHEIIELLNVLATITPTDCYHITRICLATGARWSEAENLESNHINSNKITYTDTKNGKNRSVPVSNDLVNSLPKKDGRLFKYCYFTFERAIKNTSADRHGERSEGG